jgi:hypothetical protein
MLMLFEMYVGDEGCFVYLFLDFALVRVARWEGLRMEVLSFHQLRARIGLATPTQIVLSLFSSS